MVIWCSARLETLLLAKIVIPGVSKSKSKNAQISTKHLERRRNRHDSGHAVQPISTEIIGCDSVAQVEESVELAHSFTAINQGQMASLEAKVRLPSRPLFSGSCPTNR